MSSQRVVVGLICAACSKCATVACWLMMLALPMLPLFHLDIRQSTANQIWQFAVMLIFCFDCTEHLWFLFFAALNCQQLKLQVCLVVFAEYTWNLTTLSFTQQSFLFFNLNLTCKLISSLIFNTPRLKTLLCCYTSHV